MCPQRRISQAAGNLSDGSFGKPAIMVFCLLVRLCTVFAGDVGNRAAGRGGRRGDGQLSQNKTGKLALLLQGQAFEFFQHGLGFRAHAMNFTRSA